MTNVIQLRDDDDHPLVIVHWRDIIATAGWEEGDELEPPVLKTIGWFHSSSDDTLKIGNTLSEEGKPYGITAFPTGCVDRMERLDLAP